MSKSQKLILLRALLIVMAGFWVFAPALRGDWLMGDDMYVTQNPLVNDPARLWKIWFVPGSLIEYYPIDATVQAIEWHLWHMNTLGYHLTNLTLHVLNGLLVWRLLAKFGLRYAWLGGFLFVIHPAVVESVAWITELKNTLSLFPFLFAMCAWIDYDEHARPRDYFLALGLFLVAMLCKISVAPFPLIILFYAWWKKGHVGLRDLKASAPFWAVSLALSFISVLAGDWFFKAQLHQAAGPQIGGFLTRMVIAGLSISFYFSRFFWPVGLIPTFYPQWTVDPPTLIQFLPWPILGTVICLLWSKRNGWGRHALLGLGFFLINLAPFLGLNSVSYHRFTWVMDHLMYLPMIGLIGLAVAFLEQVENAIPSPLRHWLATLTAMTLAVLAWGSHDYAKIFVGPETLYRYTVEHNPASFMAYNNLGNVLLRIGQGQEAIEAYQKALQLNPTMPEAHNNLGLAFFQLNRPPEAIEQYEQALKYDPHFGLAHSNLAHALTQVGRLQEAIAQYEQALLVNPQDHDARANLTKLKTQLQTP